MGRDFEEVKEKTSVLTLMILSFLHNLITMSAIISLIVQMFSKMCVTSLMTRMDRKE